MNNNIKNNAKEDFIKKDELEMGKNIDIIEGEDKLILEGLEKKTVKELIEMVVKLKHLSYKDARKLRKEELIYRLKYDLD